MSIGGEEFQALKSRVDELERRLSAASEDLQDFLYVVSHDLKGPLRAIMSSSMILLEDYASVLDADGQNELKRQSEAARKLNRLLEELLKLSRLGRAELKPEHLDLGELAKTAALNKGLEESTVTALGPVEIIGDRALLIKAINELVDNSVKFSQGGAKPLMEVGKEGDRYYFRDRGIGMEGERISRVFLPFERLNGDEYGGVGIGLATFKRIIDRHKGEVEAQGTPNEGATIYFTIGKA